MQQITFITNLANNTLEHAKLLLQSLKTNLDSDEHQILVFIDSDNEGTLDYLLSIKDTFKDLGIIKNNLNVPVGYARNKTILTEYAKHDVVSYLQSDMVVGPHYDTDILKHVKRGRILSSTRVEPPLHGESPVTVTRNFGVHPDEFNFNDWNSFSMSIKKDELVDFFFAPITYYKEDWLRLGGYDTVFRRAREDSDFVQRCLHADIELVQTFSANVYHFTCVSSRGKSWFDKSNDQAQQRAAIQSQADSIELRRFIRKWGTFNHGEHKLYKLDVDLVAVNYRNLQSIYNVEPFFTRVWLGKEEHKLELVSAYASQHGPANYLLNFSDEQWDTYKHLYRLEDYNSMFHVGNPDSYSVKVTMDFGRIENTNEFLKNIQNLYYMLKDCEQGQYELDGIFIDVNDIRILPTPVRAENPDFDYSLLTVY
jgi:hypothetical protein